MIRYPVQAVPARSGRQLLPRSRTSAAERRADLLRAIREFAVVKLARRVGSGDRNDLPTVGREEWLVVRASVVREAPLV